jgi:hypothetical protein
MDVDPLVVEFWDFDQNIMESVCVAADASLELLDEPLQFAAWLLKLTML